MTTIPAASATLTSAVVSTDVNTAARGAAACRFAATSGTCSVRGEASESGYLVSSYMSSIVIRVCAPIPSMMLATRMAFAMWSMYAMKKPTLVSTKMNATDTAKTERNCIALGRLPDTGGPTADTFPPPALAATTWRDRFTRNRVRPDDTTDEKQPTA